MGTEGDHPRATPGHRIARRTRGQLREFAVQRPAGTQQFHRVVVGADQHQVQLRGLGLEAGQVSRDLRGQSAGLGLRHAVARDRTARREFQRQGAEHAGCRGSAKRVAHS